MTTNLKAVAHYLDLRLANRPTASPPGHKKGCEFYSELDLLRTLRRATARFYSAHGYFPSIRFPRTFSEKMYARKFLSSIKIPESGNKLMLQYFIPPSTEIKIPRIVWSSQRSKLPSNADIASGSYYLKASHGSGYVNKVSYPLMPNDRASLEKMAESWLGKEYGFAQGEWWYCTHTPEIFLQEDVCVGESSVSWNFYVFHGVIGLIGLYGKNLLQNSSGDQSTWLWPDFSPLPDQNPKKERVTDLHTTDDAKVRMKRLAQTIGETHDFVRVDFFANSAGNIFLGELTFCPGKGLTRFPPYVDRDLGLMWKFMQSKTS